MLLRNGAYAAYDTAYIRLPATAYCFNPVVLLEWFLFSVMLKNSDDGPQFI